MGAGFLPICVNKKKIYFLFGKENNTNDAGWSDFGGSRENNEKYIDTASREGSEELNGFIGDEKTIKKMINSKKSLVIDTKGYKTYLSEIKYDFNLPEYYKNNYNFLFKKLPDIVEENNGLLEKEEIKWFSFNEIERNKNIFRDFYKNVINNILKNKEKIKKMYLKKTIKNKSKKRNNNTKRKK